MVKNDSFFSPLSQMFPSHLPPRLFLLLREKGERKNGTLWGQTGEGKHLRWKKVLLFLEAML